MEQLYLLYKKQLIAVLVILTTLGGIPALNAQSRVTSADLIGSTTNWPNNDPAQLTNAFDGNYETFVDGWENWGFVGYDMGEGTEEVIASWKFAPRQGFAGRLNGSQLRASNSSNFLNDYVVLDTITMDPVDTILTEVTLDAGESYRYIYWFGGGGTYSNIAELQFLNADGDPLSGTPIGQEGGSQWCAECTYDKAFDGDLNTYVEGPQTIGFVGYDFGPAGQSVIGWGYAPRQGFANRLSDGQGYNTELRGSNDPDYLNNYTVLSTITETPAENVITQSPIAGDNGPWRYIYWSGGVASYGNIAELELYTNELSSDNLIGSTTNWPNNEPAQLTNAFDNNFETFVDGWENWGFVGYDLGEGTDATIASWKFAPRSGFAGRLNGTQLRGSNSSNFLNEFVVLDTITTDPVDSVLTEVMINASESYRYIYWFGGGGTYSNVAELQFLDAGGNPLGGTPIGHEGGSQWCAECTYDKALDGDLDTYVEGPQTIGFVGYDFGPDGQSVSAWGYAPRPGWAWRLSDGQGYNTELRGSNDPDYLNNYTVLSTITETPPENVLTEANIAENNGPWRYIYWSGGVASYGNIAELKLYSGAINVAPTVMITSSVNGPTTVSPIPVTITFSETVLGFELSDITVGNGVADNLQEVTAGLVWTADIIPDGEGIVTVDVAADVVVDAGGKGNNAALQFSVFFNASTEDPITSADLIGSTTNWPNNDPADLTKAFDGDFDSFIDTWENWGFVGYDFGEGTGVEVAYWKYAPRTGYADRMNGSELRASNSADFLNDYVRLDSIGVIPVEGVLTQDTINSTTAYRYVYWFGGGGTFSNIAELQFLDADGNPLIGTQIGQEGASVWCAECTYDKAFDGDIETYVEGPQTIGFVGYDFGAKKGATLKSWKYAPRPGWAQRLSDGQGSNSELRGSNDPNYLNNYTVLYTVTETPPAYALTTGQITDDTPYRYVYWAGGPASYGNIAELELFGAVVDNDLPPTIQLSSVVNGATNMNPFPLTIAFSENVADFTMEDITVTNGVVYTLEEITPGKVWTAYIIPLADGTVTVDIAEGVVMDTDGNGNKQATSFSIVYDSQAPTVALTSEVGEMTDVSPILLTITFSESVSGFGLEDIVVTNATTDSLQEVSAGTVWTVQLIPVEQGTVTVDIPENAAVDVAANGNGAAAQFSVVYDGVVGVDETLRQEVKIWPNPVRDRLWISAEGFDWIELYTVLGQPLQRFRGQSNMSVDVSGFSRGIYLVKFIYKNSFFTEKIIIK
ncbi:Ig-like domain-containing protein [Flavilitoribacter nigricans]|uniref:T9SS type A sorting domain-containing protein n=1 Tax=Flavilitoribacter nigricans (strain ATCC 23147 / DSM 23189 / NBRC 102662 / NCIMB 1420 / SS-2) TaxID=1122177 RepID=A0A2D0N2T4_FLAN2|nr:Ig-like domain-containing protein [Flavilitoribacter nigricans]PHN02720.1 hypothetical protein CRP01_30520 [Flavilitoribacter nigricans DSM 23189 = NBRC 102662]